MTPEQVREVVQRVVIAAWPVAERYLKRTREEFTAAEHSIVVSRFQGAAIDYINRGRARLASELFDDAKNIEAALKVLGKHEAMFASHAQLLDPGAIRAAMKSFAAGLRRGADAFKKYPENRGFFYCLGARFNAEVLPTAGEAVKVYNALVDAIGVVAPRETPTATYVASRDGSAIRSMMKSAQG